MWQAGCGALQSGLDGTLRETFAVKQISKAYAVKRGMEKSLIRERESDGSVVRRRLVVARPLGRRRLVVRVRDKIERPIVVAG